ncbi:helix-turn-helix domain-containing protein [Enterococcus casseliflavus]|uniref:helix-turn-helix domain-containing protein n=1 Tax=Enterococcus casseliflavus TaxID=37734 RepID=UPI00129CBA35|nr:helix-turn-helix domain-containing protein [Enterococcus casseliflavus]MRI69070.1 helix-turn-helix domain-containing protein [Enterococcus casseliflavus]
MNSIEEITLDSLLERAIQEVLNRELIELKSLLATLSNNHFSGYLTMKDACDYLSVSRNTLAKYINEYDLPITIIEGTKRIKKSDLDEFMLSKQC